MSKNIMENSFNNDRLENEACDKFENLINSFSIATHSNGANDEKSVAFPNEYGGALTSSTWVAASRSPLVKWLSSTNPTAPYCADTRR